VTYLRQYFGIFLDRQQEATTLADIFRDFIQFFVQNPRTAQYLPDVRQFDCMYFFDDRCKLKKKKSCERILRPVENKERSRI